MRVLIVCGSKRGGTEGLARMLAEALPGHEVDVRKPRGIDGVGAWDAVIVGGALYAGRWPRALRRFVERHAEELRRVPVWFFSSGPLGEEHQQPDIPPTPQVQGLMAQVGARDHVTFGGRLSEHPGGFIAGAMAKRGMAGDWRSPEAVAAWARQIEGELDDHTPTPPAAVKPQRALRVAAGVMTLLVGLTATGGGVELILLPHGADYMGLDSTILQHSPFTDFVIPGVLLMVFVGLLNLAAAVTVLRRHPLGEPASVAAGVSMTTWILVEVALLRTFHPLHALYGGLGLATLAVGATLWRRRKAGLRPHTDPP
ncbi:MAG: hypothetical protein H6739_36065 [Alphaproteobacteria bacterium]|nr:hypothetical protein [Alphaproteobacteria bacterium]